MNLLLKLAAFGDGLFIIPLLTLSAGIFFVTKGYFEQKKFKSVDASGNVAPFWKYAPTIAGILLLIATAIICFVINSEW